MKKFIVLILLLSFINGISQNLSEKQIERLNLLQISTDNLKLDDSTVQYDMNQILKFDQKRKTNKTIAIVLSATSVASFLAGGVILNKNESKSHG